MMNVSEFSRPVVSVDFIAEISSNHNQNLDRAVELIKVASLSGFDSVKFQLFKVSDLFHKDVLRARPDLQMRKKWELFVNWIPELSEVARREGLKFGLTPFYLGALDNLAEHLDFVKIASYELLWDDLLLELVELGKPIIVSTGMANMEEITHANQVLTSRDTQPVTFMHCISAYPAPSQETNLAAIRFLKDALGLKIGWSDHTRSPGVIHRAVHRWGAEVVEMHFDLDGNGFEFEPGHCWLPDEAERVIREIRGGLEADGSGVKEPAPSELLDREWRADPSDGLRPLKHMRAEWRKEL